MDTSYRDYIRKIILEELALDEMETCEGSGCSEEDDLDEFSGAGAIAGYTLPLGMRPSGPRRDIVKTARKSFGGLGGRKSR